MQPPEDNSRGCLGGEAVVKKLLGVVLSRMSADRPQIWEAVQEVFLFEGGFPA